MGGRFGGGEAGCIAGAKRVGVLSAVSRNVGFDMETERFFEERKNRADRKAFRRILNRKGGEPPRPEDAIG